MKKDKLQYGKFRQVIPGIVGDAKTLGVSRQHLYLVLTGQRVSDGLVRRYQELKAEELAGCCNHTVDEARG